MFKDDFPIFKTFKGTYLDSAASAQKPESVLKAMEDFYRKGYANIHRGMYGLSENATALYEESRKVVARFINAPEKSIVFTKGATEAINLVASSFPFQEGDEIILSAAEHHANFLPWKHTKATVKIAPVTETGALDMEAYKNLFTKKTRFVAIAHASNVLGTIFPVKEIIRIAHEHKTLVLVDGAQGVIHEKTDVKEMDCDFYAFSGHKLYGPTGIGILYGKEEALRILSPYQYGGDMVKSITKTKIEFQDIPTRFEAGTPPIAEAIGLKAAIEYYAPKRMQAHKQEKKIFNLLQDYLLTKKGIRILGTEKHKTPVISFISDFAHPQDVGMILAHENICVRVGHHCAIPLHEAFSCHSTVRASVGMYNTEKDVEAFVKAYEKAERMLK